MIAKKLYNQLHRLSSTKKNILVLTSGSIIGQGLVILVSPILSRLYLPEAFGILALYTSISTILASLFTGKYEQAIFHPKNDSKSLNIIVFATLLSFILSIILFFVLFFLKISGFNIKIVTSLQGYIFLVPISTFTIGFYSCLQLWFQRKEQYLVTSITSIIQSVILVILNFSVFYLGSQKYGLVIGYFFSILLSMVFLIVIFLRNNYFKYNKTEVNYKNSLLAAREYINFPKYILWAEFIMTLSQQFLPILFTSLYSSAVVGLYAFSNRILRIPSILISNSVWGVYRNEAIKLKGDKSQMLVLYKKTFKHLVYWGFLPFFVILLFGEEIFIIIFGSPWGKSGVYAKIMSIYLYTEFISYPLSSTFIVFNKQKIYLFIQLSTLILGVGGIIMGKFIGDDYLSILLFSVFGIICNVISLVLSYKTIIDE